METYLMKTSYKFFIGQFLFNGLIFAVLNAGFDYADGTEFRFLKFGFNFLVFGLVMALVFTYAIKNK
jgi:hypothetical protein